jgi:phosphoribosyl-dephospho-CoA transferase
MELIAHDLIRVKHTEDLVSDLPLPEWAVESLRRTPYVVVRRAAHPHGFVGVGIRGQRRGQRAAAWLRLSEIDYVIQPRVLSCPQNWMLDYMDEPIHPISSLKQVAPILTEKGFDWGPTGSTGFELATGVMTVTEYSDLDIVLNVSIPFSTDKAASLLLELEEASVSKLDVQLNTPTGGVSLLDYVNSSKVLVKTDTGPVLANSADIWTRLN